MIYLCVKTHLQTGLRYLCKTEQDPHIYQGSGSYWKRHIKKHGNDVRTDIVFQSEIKEEIKEKGLYYSELWNVVESKDWANLIPESGSGGSPKGRIGSKGKRGPQKNPRREWSEARRLAKQKEIRKPYGPRDPSKIKEPWNKGKKCPTISKGIIEAKSRRRNQELSS